MLKTFNTFKKSLITKIINYKRHCKLRSAMDHAERLASEVINIKEFVEGGNIILYICIDDVKTFKITDKETTDEFLTVTLKQATELVASLRDRYKQYTINKILYR